MVIQKELLVKKLNYLGMAISKDPEAKIYTKLIRFQNTGDKVYAYTFDGINSVKVEIGTIDAGSSFYAVVEYTLFNNFIKSCEGDIKLETKDKFMHIKASNVKCKIPVYNKKNDGDFNIPDPENDYPYDRNVTEAIDLGIIKSILNIKHVVPIYRNIFFGDYIMVSDTDNVLKIEKKIFDHDILLSISSVEILNAITNIRYNFVKEDNVVKLCITSDELSAKIITIKDENSDFQYEDFNQLYNEVSGATVTLDASTLSKAMSASQLFNVVPKIVFNKKGIFVQIDNNDFIYKISDTACDEDRAYEFPPDLARKLCTMGSELTVYYTNSDLLRCDVGNVSEILSIKEIKNE